MSGISDFFKLFIHRRFFSKAKIEEYQFSQLKALIEFAKEHSAFYKETLDDVKINTLSDIRQLPIINKNIMMANFDRLNTVHLTRDEVMSVAVEKELNKDYLGYYKDEFVIGLSSGTSGNKGLYITPKSLTERLPFVFLARSGIPLRYLPYKILFMLRVFSQGFNDINSPLISLNYLSTMTAPDEIIRQINTRKINILMAPPSLCRILIPVAHLIKKPLKMIVTYAEVLEKEEKIRLGEVFGCRVIEIYQGSEGQFASACPMGNLHINEDLIFVELLDENYNEVNTPHIAAAHMIATNLVNLAQPLIRYEMNDLIVLDDPCVCGSHFRTIEKILGRNDDILYFKKKDGSIQHIFPDLFSRWIITSSENIREYKVIQHVDHSIKILLDPIITREQAELVQHVRSRLQIELAAYDIDCPMDIHCESIILPANRSKYKRFEVNKDIAKH
jgi:putative adenylate-forming enzyme